MYIYKTTNILNGKIYIGQSKFEPEENPAYLGSGYILQKAINCYGKNNFRKEILEKCKDEIQLCERERFWISTLHANDREIGYNISEGGTWGDSWTHNPRKEELRKHFSEITIGEKNPNFGNRWTSKQKKIASIRSIKNKVWIDKKTGLNFSKLPEVKQKLSEQKRGLNNPNGYLWKLISPIGEEFLIESSIKHNIKKYGVDYQSFYIFKDKTDRKNRDGWRLLKINKEIVEKLTPLAVIKG